MRRPHANDLLTKRLMFQWLEKYDKILRVFEAMSFSICHIESFIKFRHVCGFVTLVLLIKPGQVQLLWFSEAWSRMSEKLNKCGSVLSFTAALSAEGAACQCRSTDHFRLLDGPYSLSIQTASTNESLINRYHDNFALDFAVCPTLFLQQDA